MTTRATNRSTAERPASRATDLRTAGGVTIFLADWVEVAFVHFAVHPAVLRPHVPPELELDLFDGRAWVSLVAFTQQRLRPAFGGRMGELLAAPLADHEFLNLRTYVRHEGEAGIYFLAEWIPNALAAFVGPRLYGLPYRLADVTHASSPGAGTYHTAVSTSAGCVRIEARHDPRTPLENVIGRDAFLLERYTAWTKRGHALRRFRIWHEPWAARAATAELPDRSVLHAAMPWLGALEATCAHYSSGVHDVWIGPPVLLKTETRDWPQRHTGTEAARSSHACHQAHGGKSGIDAERFLTRPSRTCVAGRVGLASMSLWPTSFWESANGCGGRLALRAAPLVALPAAVIALSASLPAWLFMWALAAAIFFGCKWLTWVDALRAGATADVIRSLCYFFAWPGMDARAFLDRAKAVSAPQWPEWLGASTTAAVGATLLWEIARLVLPEHPLLGGWVGMIGLVLLLHFGAFRLLALAWRSGGIDAQPLMNAPALARSVAEFWGERWNRGFHRLAMDHVFRPLRRRLGARGALVAAFVVSGLVHDLVISVPARAGYGLPTAYFLIQAFAVLAERRFGRSRLLTVVVTAAPAPLLFHAPFIERVILPFMHAIGAAN